MSDGTQPAGSRISRRAALERAAALASGAALGLSAPSLAGGQVGAGEAAKPAITAPPDATRIPGLPSTARSERSPFESPALSPVGVVTGPSFTPLQDLTGTITPADLHFQRHHNGIAVIDPARYALMVHGLVERPLSFSLDDLRRFPAVTRTCFIECSGNGRAAFRQPRPDMTPGDVDGLTGNTEWTGVPVSTLLREAGVRPGASWVLAEGGDAAVLSRSVPMSKMQDDALVVYAQNGEPLRMANGYPARLLLPGYEGNMCIKWLRRLKAIPEPNMSRDETAKYTDPLPGGRARQFSFVMDAKSIITSPAYPMKLAARGVWPVRGLAWSGRGRIARVEVSTDGGARWSEAKLLGTPLPMAHVRFEHLWEWDGSPTTLMSRATDESGYVQPSREAYTKARGPGTDYHFNPIRSWKIARDGQVTFGG